MQKWIVLLFSVWLLSSSSGCQALAKYLGKTETTERAKDESSDEIAAATKPKPPGSKSRAKDAAKPGSAGTGKVNYFEDASSLPKRYKTKIGGPTRVLEILIYPTYGHAQIIDPKKPDQANEFEIRDDVVANGVPVSDPPDKDDIQRSSFDIDEPDYALMPQMVKTAQTQLKLEKGTVTHIIVKRWLPFSEDVRFRVYVEAPRGSGSVEYDAKGKFLQTHQD